MIIYAICLVVGLLFTIISAIVGHFFGGHEGTDVGTGGHAEAGFDESGVPGISFFSPTVLASFVTAFGAFGLIFTQIEATSSPWASAPLSLAGGGVVAKTLAKSGRYHAVVCLGCVIKGETPHFDYVAGEAAKGVAQAASESGVPVLFGVLTANTMEQAIDRAGGKMGNRGYDAAVAAIEMANLRRQLL